MAMPLARTSDEAHLYMELHPCPCGEPDFGSTSSMAEVDGGWRVRYAGRCVECGRPRTFEFRAPAETSVPAESAWADGDQPSELLDAGEWLWVADTYGGTSADLSDLSESMVELARADLLAAAGAVDEVLKFLPPGADEVPDTAFWSDRGRSVRAAEPGRFRRIRLEAARDTYRRLAAGNA